MRRLISIIPIILYLLLPVFYAEPVLAAAPCAGRVGVTTVPPQPIPEGSSFDITFKPVDAGSYQFRVGNLGDGTAWTDPVEAINNSVTLKFTDPRFLKNGTWTGTLTKDGRNNDYCGDVSYKIGYQFSECLIEFLPADIKTTQPFQVHVTHAAMGSYDIYTAAPPQ